jgi:hypothetical protein
MFNDRRKMVEAVAKSGAIKAMPKKEPKKLVPVENISKPATRFFGQATLKGRGKPKMVEPGSKKEAKLKAKISWAEEHEKKSGAKFDARMKSLKETGKM